MSQIHVVHEVRNAIFFTLA